MSLDSDRVISAQVLLRSASGKVIDAETAITSENIHEYAPSPDTVAKASAVLAKMGFQVGEAVGISLSITAPASTFERVFGTEFRQTEDGGIQVVAADGTVGEEVPLAHWPEELVGLAVAVAFLPPPEYHPHDAFWP